jgi:EAL domain-containing protein (putative c-di-GMP-specific phosphodiesterase class I)/GGDEF domain-containing protein
MDNNTFMVRYMELGKKHYKLGIPLFNIISAVNFIKDEIYTLLASKHTLDNNFLKLNKIFGQITTYMSKGYFLEEIDIVHHRHIEEMSDTIFYRLHIKWVVDFLKSMRSNNIKNEPHFISYEHSDFRDWLESPYAKIIVRNDFVKNELVTLNKHLYSLANSIYFHISINNYFEAVALLQNFSNDSIHMMHILNKYALEHFSTKEEVFFSFIKDKSQFFTGYLSSINIRKLSIINKYRGYNFVDIVLRDVGNAIKAFVITLDNDIVFIQNQSNEFLIFYSKTKIDEIKRIQIHLKSLVENLIIRDDDVEMSVKIAIGTIKMFNEHNHNNIEKVLHYAISKAKEMPDEIYYLKHEEGLDALEVIKKSENNLHFVQNALLQNNLDVFFQPIFDLHTGKLFDVEVLARIKSGEMHISAATFIDLIYELDIIVDLDIKILEKLNKYLVDIIKVTNNIFINVSPTSLLSHKYLDKLEQSLTLFRLYNIQPIFELTEQAFLENLELVKEIHHRYRIKFAVDDFGTGFSSLKTVAELSENNVIEYIKIDGSIIKNIMTSDKTFHILDATNYMTKKLGLKNIAEFIETEDVLEKVRSLGIHYGQGYYFSQPLHISDLLKKYSKVDICDLK